MFERVSHALYDHKSSPVASNQSQGVLVKQDDSADVNMAPPTSEPALFATFESATEIDYSPEASLRQGLGMVNALKSTVKTLKLGSKLRVDVWDRELKRCGITPCRIPLPYSYGLQPGVSDLANDVDRCMWG